MSKAGLPPQTQEPRLQFYQGLNRCGSFLLLSASHSLFTMSSAHSPTFPSFHLRNSSFSNPSVAVPTSQPILQHFRCFTYVTAHSLTLLSLRLRHRLFTYVTWPTAHEKGPAQSPTLPLLHLRHSSFSNPSFISPTSQALQ